ncbi:MAG: ATP-binding protein, partial [Methyloligellaceae bacterium]
DPRIDQRVRQYLYGRQLNELSQRSVTALDPNDGEDRAFEIIESLGRMMWTTERAALVYCIDQVEDLRFFEDSEERFQKAIRDLIQIANRVPSCIILISCLDDFYFQMRDFLPQSFIDRIEKAGPVLLRESRTAAEARQIVEKRIAHILDKAGEIRQDVDAASLFGDAFCDELAGLSTRRLLEAVELRRRELYGGGESEADGFGSAEPAIEIVVGGMQQRWERFMLDYQVDVPEEEEALARILREALALSAREDAKTDIAVAPVEGLDKLSAIDLSVRSAQTAAFETRLFLCNKRSQGGSLKRQIEKVIDQANGHSRVILRTSEFPANPKSVTGQYLLRFKGDGGECLVAPIYEWERMMTLQAFYLSHKSESDFERWMRSARILHDLPSIGKLLRLDEAASGEKDVEHVAESHPVSEPAPVADFPEPETVQEETPAPEINPESERHGETHHGEPALTDGLDPEAPAVEHTIGSSNGNESGEWQPASSEKTAARMSLPPVEEGPSLEQCVAETFVSRQQTSPNQQQDASTRPGFAARIARWIMPPPPPDAAAAEPHSVGGDSAPRLDNVHHLEFSNRDARQDGALPDDYAAPDSDSDILPMQALDTDVSPPLAKENIASEPGSASSLRPDEDQASAESQANAEDANPDQPLLSAWPEAREHEIRAGRVLGTADEQVGLPITILKRHVAVLGGSGSGKTTLALNLIEQLLLRDIPVVLIDRKGDLCSYANSEFWPSGGDGDEESVRLRRRLREKTDVAVYTPGRVSGRPISITLLPNGIVDLPAHELQQLANVSAVALSDMLHLGNSATHQKQCGILTVGLRELGSMATREVTLADLIALLEDDYDDLIDETQRMDPSGKLRRDLIAQLDSLRHRNWALFEGGGEPLSMDSLLGLGPYAKPDKTRLSIIYTGFLGDNENILFWVAQFLSEALRFSQRNPNEDLQAVIMFDEADLYIPASSKPATKEPLESLLRRARSAGIGLLLATQSPGDLDYKSRDQITSWFIGKVREDTALKKLKAAFASETGIDPASALPNQKVGEFHLIQEGSVQPMKADMSLIKAEQVAFDRIEEFAAGTVTTKRKKKQLLFDFG